MSLAYTYHNPLKRDGTSQRKRMLEALKTDFVKVDEREIQDWISYAQKYAKLIQYYNKQNVADGDWALFIEKDISTLIAMVSQTDIAAYKSRFDIYKQNAEEAESTPESETAFAKILVLLYEMAEQISGWYANAVPELSLHKTLSRLIESRLEGSFAALLSWLLKAKQLKIPLLENGLPPISLNRRRNSWPNVEIPVAVEAFSKGIPNRKKEIDQEIFYLDCLFKRFFEVTQAVVTQAPAYLEESFTNYPQHQPHIALFLTFLNLMKFARDNMNTLTKRHLDFYYKDVLQLKNQAEIPDEVHLIFELANNFRTHKIEKGTSFDAGDDKDGEQLIYTADDEIVVNRAVLDEEHGLKSIFVEKAYKITNPGMPDEHVDVTEFEIVNIYAASDADSINGSGEALPDDDPKWALLGDNKIPYGEVGFAIASPLLLLKEGVRTITLTFSFSNLPEVIEKYTRTVLKTELKNNVKVYLTGEEEWIEITDKQVEVKNELVYTFTLQRDVPSILPYNEEVHQSGFDTEFPVVRFIMDNEGLDTLGDLDMSLDAGIEIFDENSSIRRLFLSNEFVLVQEKEGVKSIYRANGEVFAASIADLNTTDPVWQLKKTDIGPYQEDYTYLPGELISHQGLTKRATAEFRNVPPESTLKLWRNINEENFDSNALYLKNSLIFWKGDLYHAIEDINEPGHVPGSSDLWRIVEDYDSGLTYEKGWIVYFQDSYYKATVASKNKSPEDEQLIWERIPVFIPENSYSKGDRVAYSKADDGERKIYQLNALSNILISDSTLINPDSDLKIWTGLPTGIADLDDTKNNKGIEVGFVETDNEGNEWKHVYKLRTNTVSRDPDSEYLIWQEVEDYEQARIKQGVKVRTDCKDGISCKVFRLLADSDFTLADKENRIKPSSNRRQPIWKEIDNYDVLLSEDQIGNLSAGDLVGKGTQIYQLIADDGTTTPGTGDEIWKDKRTYGLLNEDLKDQLRRDDIVGHNGDIYQLKADGIRRPEQDGKFVDPNPNDPIWVRIPNYKDHDTGVQKGDLVGEEYMSGSDFKGRIYRLLADANTISPLRSNKHTKIPIKNSDELETITMWFEIFSWQDVIDSGRPIEILSKHLDDLRIIEIGEKKKALEALETRYFIGHKGILYFANDLSNVQIEPGVDGSGWQSFEGASDLNAYDNWGKDNFYWEIRSSGRYQYWLCMERTSTHPSSKIWAKILTWDEVQNSSDPVNTLKAQNYLVGHKGAFYTFRFADDLANQTHEPKDGDGSPNDSSWDRPHNEYFNLNTSPDRNKNTFYFEHRGGESYSYWKCNESTSIHPSNNKYIWEEIYDGVSEYDEDIQYIAFANTNPFTLVKDDNTENVRFYEIQTNAKGIYPSDNNQFNNYTNPEKIWKHLISAETHKETVPYFKDDYVKTGNSPYRYFQATVKNMGVLPGGSDKVWKKLRDAVDVKAKNPDGNPLQVPFESKNPYVYQVDENNNEQRFFEALVQLTLGLNADPASGENGGIPDMWQELGTAKPFDPQITYFPFEHPLKPNNDVSFVKEKVNDSTIIFEVQEKFAVGEEDKGDRFDPFVRVWEFLGEAYLYDEKNDKETQFPRTVNGRKNPFVFHDDQFFKANVLTVGEDPDIDKAVWEGAFKPSEYDIKSTYTKTGNPYVFLNKGASEVYYYTEADEVSGIDPEDNQFFWEVFISSYTPELIYQKGDSVLFKGIIFQAQAQFRDIVPTSDTLLWENFYPSEIAAYEAKTPFKVGEYTDYEGSLYKANYSTIGVSPAKNSEGEMTKVWQQLDTQIVLYRSQKTFRKGDHVEYKGKYYRALAQVTGIKPDSDPLSWRLVGVIVDYNKSEPYYTHMHASYKGKVYRALKDIDPRRMLVADPETDKACWAEVPRSYPYKYFHQLDIDKLNLFVSVSDMQDLILENDDGVINPAKAFNPFGSAPVQGSSLYIGSHEVFQKKLAGFPANLTLNIVWGDLPEIGFAQYYAFYKDPSGAAIDTKIGSNQYFIANVEVLDGSEWIRPIEKPITLFKDVKETIPGADRELSFDEEIYPQREPGLAPFTAFNHRLERGFIRIQLETDFFHGDYPKSLALEASDDTTNNIPNIPYTPLINEMKLSYVSEENIAIRGSFKRDFTSRPERLFFISPFGQSRFIPLDESQDDGEGPVLSANLVPKFEATIIDSEGVGKEDDDGNPLQRDANGNLYIGVRNLEPPQNLTLLIQLAEGSENPDRGKQRVIWSYLKDNRWTDFTLAQLISDTTHGLLRSGIVKLDIPREIGAENTLFPKEIFWIRASVVDYADGVAKGIAIIPQVVKASYRKQENNDPLHLRKPLVADSITALLSRQAGITSVSQPFASYGGRLSEQDEELYIRISERLRHKSRGITIYDYERLVLQEFPQVYKAKCINHSRYGNDINPDTINEMQAGKVSIVVISDLRNKNAVDKLRPVLSVNTRLEIQEFLEKKTSCFANIEVISPLFEEVMVESKVEFKPGLDKGFYTKQLQKDIVRFLAPWLFDEEAELVFGNKMTASALTNFIDEQNYVDFITDMVLYHRIDENETFKKVKGDEVITCGSASVLVPVPEEAHIIIPNIEEKCLTLDS